jgi:hypothetical protein
MQESENLLSVIVDKLIKAIIGGKMMGTRFEDIKNTLWKAADTFQGYNRRRKLQGLCIINAVYQISWMTHMKNMKKI